MAPRNTTTRDKHRKAIARTRADCHICHEPIDYSLPYMNPGEFVVDHVIPLAKGGQDVLENKAAAHRSCNSTKAASLPPELDPRRQWVTERDWWSGE